jgi:hypothetical protein
MVVELCLPVKSISEDDLVEVFKRFCTAFDIEFFERDEREVRRRGIDDLIFDSEFEYRVAIGIKFYAKSVSEKQIRFHGNFSSDNSNSESQNARFQELVLEYFADRIN